MAMDDVEVQMQAQLRTALQIVENPISYGALARNLDVMGQVP